MAENIPKVLTSQDCLVTLMMAISASDGRILTAELVKIQSAVNHLPIRIRSSGNPTATHPNSHPVKTHAKT